MRRWLMLLVAGVVLAACLPLQCGRAAGPGTTSSAGAGLVVGVSGPQRWELDGGAVDVSNTHTLVILKSKEAAFVVDVLCGPQFPCPADLAQLSREDAAQMGNPLVRHVIANGLHTRHFVSGPKLTHVGVTFRQRTPGSAVIPHYRYFVPLAEAEGLADGGG